MDFIRAKNEKNKQIRMKQIKEAAILLLDSCPYHEITLSKIGSEICFTRANLYKYVSSKEDIYIRIAGDEITELLDTLESAFSDHNELDTREFAQIMASVTTSHKRFLKLFSLLFSLIEQNTNESALVEFKKCLSAQTDRFINIIKEKLPGFSNENAFRLLDHIFSYMISRYPICYPSKKQLDAMEKADFNYITPDFEKTFSDVLVLIINGIKLENMQ